MKAVGIKDGKGDANALFIEDGIPDPTPKEGEVLVRIRAFGLNRMDTMQREGNYPALPHWGDVLGVEFGGEVEQLGQGCTQFSKGEKVFSLAYGGCYAEKKCVSEKMLMKMPDNMSFEEAAGTPETYFTALQAVYLLGDMQPGKTALIHAGASGVGLSAIQIAKTLGASKVFVTAGTDDKCQICKSVGADVAINYRTSDFAEVIDKETDGRGVDLIVDMVGRDYWNRNVKIAAVDSRIVIVALLSGSKLDDFDLKHIMPRRICLMTTTLRTRSSAYQVNLRNTFVEKILPALSNGSAKTIVDTRFSIGKMFQKPTRGWKPTSMLGRSSARSHDGCWDGGSAAIGTAFLHCSRTAYAIHRRLVSNLVICECDQSQEHLGIPQPHSIVARQSFPVSQRPAQCVANQCQR